MTKQRNLLERLRSGFGGLVPPVCDEAANEIERLQKALDSIRIAGSTPGGDLINQSAKVAAYALQDEPTREHCPECGDHTHGGKL